MKPRRGGISIRKPLPDETQTQIPTTLQQNYYLSLETRKVDIVIEKKLQALKQKKAESEIT